VAVVLTPVAVAVEVLEVQEVVDKAVVELYLFVLLILAQICNQ
jgi:hypothetical protein